MNKYIIPISDFINKDVWNEIILARSINECKDKLMESLMENYEELEESDSYKSFVKQCLKKDLIIGDITDIETL